MTESFVRRVMLLTSQEIATMLASVFVDKIIMIHGRFRECILQ